MTLYSLKVNVLVIHYLLHNIKQFFDTPPQPGVSHIKIKDLKLWKNVKEKFHTNYFAVVCNLNLLTIVVKPEAICFILIFHLFISFPRDWALDVDGSLQITLHGTWQNFSSFFYIPTLTLLSSLERKKGGPQFINGSSGVNDYPPPTAPPKNVLRLFGANWRLSQLISWSI